MDPNNTPLESWSRIQDREKTKAPRIYCLQQGYDTERRDENLMFRNLSQRELDRNVTFDILNNYKDNCSTCRGIIYRTQKLIKDIEDIMKMESYAICDHCLLAGGQCLRCDNILGKLPMDQRALLVERYQRFKLWLCKAKQLIDTIVNREQICQGSLHRQTFKAVEFENLVRQLNTPIYQRHVEDSCRWADEFTLCKVMLREIIAILKMTKGTSRWTSEGILSELKTKMNTLGHRFTSVENLLPSKLSQEGKNVGRYSATRISPGNVAIQKPSIRITKSNSINEGKKSKLKAKQSKDVINVTQSASKVKKSKLKLNRSKGLIDGQTPSIDTISRLKFHRSQDVIEDRKSLSEDTISKFKLNESKDEMDSESISEETINTLMLKQSEDVTEDSQLVGEEKKNTEIDGDKTDNNKQQQVEHENKLKLNDGTNEDNVPEFIIGEYERRNIRRFPSLIYKLIPESSKDDTGCIFPEYKAHHVKAGRFENIDGVKMQLPKKGTILYKLSDKTYIDMGWTKLPKSKVIRRLNVYKMEPTKPNWFDQIMDGTTLTYRTGEKLATLKGRRGKWFYKNGTVALDCYYDHEGDKKQWSIKRYVIYSHDEDPDQPQSVLACFDDFGNGVVYDMNGKVRLKYNQSEGQLIDPKGGLSDYWKWHMLNEPPDLEDGFIDTHPKDPSHRIDKMITRRRESVDENKIRFFEYPMISIERQNVENEEKAAEKRKYKPNKVKLRNVRINDYFSLRLFEQPNISVFYKDGDKHLKLNLGIWLSNTVIGFHVVDPVDVAIPYTNTPSAQSSLTNIKDQEKMREKLLVVKPRNRDFRQFELKRKFHNVLEADASKMYTSTFKLFLLR